MKRRLIETTTWRRIKIRIFWRNLSVNILSIESLNVSARIHRGTLRGGATPALTRQSISENIVMLAPLSGGKNRPSRGFTCCQACLSSPSYASCCAEIPLRVAEKGYCPIAYNNCLGKRILVNTVPWTLRLQFRRELETDRLLTNIPLPSKFIAHLLCTLLSRDIKINEPEASAEERGRGLALLSHPTYVSSYSL